MLPKGNAYDAEMIRTMELERLKPEDITRELEKYLEKYKGNFLNSSQRKYFETYEKGLLSDLERKTIEPIALTLLEETEVRGFQQFFGRANFSDEELLEHYQTQLAETLGEAEGFLSVDGSDFPKKGTHSVGVSRQYCGRLGKTENCQAGIFVGYATSKGYGLVNRALYMPEEWFSKGHKELRKKCKVPETLTFQTKNEIAQKLIQQVEESGKFPVKWIGCDAAFGCDHSFLRGLPKGVYYFAAVKGDELVFPQRPDMVLPKGRNATHPRPSIPPVPVKSIAADDSIPWDKRALAQGTKGPILAEVKCIRCTACDANTPTDDVWLYLRKYADGTVKYFLCNGPDDLQQSVLDKLATMRWSIEQCFQECKSYLGMTHYETRTYVGWLRHMQMVMIAHLFTTVLRLLLQKKPFDHAYGQSSYFRCPGHLP